MELKNKRTFENTLLSSDYFLRLCNGHYPKSFKDFQVSIDRSLRDCSKDSVFLDGISASAYFDQLAKASVVEGTSIYIHKSDVIPSEDLFKKMFDLGLKLYSINWLGDKQVCTPIPIGIPPGSFNKFHGKFIRRRADGILTHSNTKKYRYHVNFDITTNIIHRKAALQAFMHIPETFMPNHRLDPQEYLSAIVNSKYVICPPGAGADTYRAWEAIYLGSIPVVLEDFWAFGHLDLPVIQVKTYADFLSKVSIEEEMVSQAVTKDFIVELPKKFR